MMLLALALAAAMAQDWSAGAPLAARVAATDSQAVSRSARQAQADFERSRRQNLPLASAGGGRCDVRIGRFCYWHDDDEYPGPDEPARIATLRGRLLTKLASAARQLPGDGWVAGQQVRYLVEDGRARDAVQAARGCAAERWWCAALEGFALHAAHDGPAADSLYALALSAMAPDARCRWTDISVLLDDDVAKHYDDLPCPARDSVETRFWALARPLYLRDANDIRIEHFARLTMAQLERVSRMAQEMSWGDDVRELIVRYGWPTRWSREQPLASDPMAVRVVGYDPTPSFDFAPAAHAVRAPADASDGDWDVHDREARTRYAPSYAKAFLPLAHQLAFFRRGDSAVVVAAFDVRRDSSFRRDAVRSAFALIAPAGDSVALVRGATGSRRETLVLARPWSDSGAVASIEVFDSSAAHVARARHGVRPPPSLTSADAGLSDLLLYDPTGEPPASLDDARARARGSLRVRADSAVGVFWEAYGFTRAGESLSYALTVTGRRESWIRRSLRSLGIGAPRAPVHMRWSEPVVHPGPVVARALIVDLSHLPPGRYRMALTIDAPGRPSLVAAREVVVER